MAARSQQSTAQCAAVMQVQGMPPRTPLSTRTERRLAHMRGDMARPDGAGASGTENVLAMRLPSMSPIKQHSAAPLSPALLRSGGDGCALAPLVAAGNSLERARPLEGGKQQRTLGGIRLASSDASEVQSSGRQQHAAVGKQADDAAAKNGEGRKQSQIPR